MIKIFIADDHTLLRDGLKQLISDIDDLEVIGEASRGSEVIAKMMDISEFDVVLLDIQLPETTGLDLIPQIKTLHPGSAILILTMYPEEQYAIQAIRIGASGYFTKDGTPEDLIAAIRKVAGGGKYISSSLAEKLASYVEEDSQKLPHETLSQREYQIMLMIASGKTLKEVANSLNIGITTVSTYRQRILQKMHMSRNINLTHYAIKHQLINIRE